MARRKRPLVRVRPYAGVSLLRGVRPFLGLRVSVNAGEVRRRVRDLSNDDHAGVHGPARKSLFNDS